MNSAATLVAEARSAEELSRRALARRAGVPTSTVTRIESGEVDPTVTMLARILAAAGRELVLVDEAVADRPSLARLADAYDATGRGTKVDWARLRGFVAWLRRHPDQLERSISTPPPRTGSVLDQLLAAMAEKLAGDAGVPVPRWVSSVPPLPEPWYPPGTPRMLAGIEARVPAEFRRRNVFLPELALWRGDR